MTRDPHQKVSRGRTNEARLRWMYARVALGIVRDLVAGRRPADRYQPIPAILASARRDVRRSRLADRGAP